MIEPGLAIISSSRRHLRGKGALELVEEVVQGWDALLQSLPLPRLNDDDAGLGVRIHRAAGEPLPMVEHTLREGLREG